MTMDNKLEKIMKQLRADKDFADLSEEELLEMAKMELGAKEIGNYVQSAEKSDEKTDKKPKTVKVSDEKKALFGEIYLNLREIFGENVQIITENKLISVYQGDKTFKIDIIEQRKKKKGDK